MKNKLSQFMTYVGLGPEHRILAFFCLIIVGIFQCMPKAEEETYTAEITNTLDENRENVLVYIPIDELSNSNNLVAYAEDEQVPTQYVSRGKQKGLYLVLDQLGPEESTTLKIREASEKDTRDFPKRTQAEISVKKGGEFQDRKYIGGSFENIDSLRVPDEHTDHSYYIRYEGPGWESEKVGYRFYLDWRNATDAFGKKTNEVVLQKVGLDGFDSYHEMQEWGMDIQKVGSSLGIGTPAIFHDGKVVRIDSTDSVISKVLENGIIYSAIQTNYYGWNIADQKLDVESVISIHAGTRLSHLELDITGNPENISTGIGKDKSSGLFSDQGDEDAWGYLATYGKQSLNNDNVGYVVFFAPDSFTEFTEDEHSHIVKLNPEKGKVDYYFAAAWELEPEGIKNEEAFLEFVKKTAQELAKPVRVKI